MTRVNSRVGAVGSTPRMSSPNPFFRILGSCLVLAAGCSSGAPSGVDPDAGSDVSANVTATAPISIEARADAITVLRATPSIGATFAAAGKLERTLVGFRARAETAAPSKTWRSTGEGALDATLPLVADGPMHLAFTGHPGFFLDVRAIDARSVAGELTERAVVFPEIALDTDLVHVATTSYAEEYRVLHSARAPSTLRYSIALGPEVAAIVVDQGRIEAYDKTGKHSIKSAPLFAVDAKGRRKELTLTLDGEGSHRTASATLDTSGLELPIAIDPVWTAAKPMSGLRQNAAAVLIPSTGRVLVAGGYPDLVTKLSTAETYDPTTDTWSSITSMTKGKAPAHAALVSSSSVLVTGDSDTTAELWNGTTWTSSTMVSSRQWYGITALGATGKVLVAGGPGFSTAEVFNAGSWTATTGNMSTIRYLMPLVWLPTVNKALVIGGTTPTGTSKTTELFDPATTTWAASGSMTYTRSSHGAVVLSSGNVLVFAGNGDLASPTTAELYNASTGTWSLAGTLAVTRNSQASGALLSTGRVLVAGGWTGSLATSTSEVYDPPTNAWITTSPMTRGALSNQMLTAIGSGKALAAGGLLYGGTAVSTAEIFQQQANGGTCLVGGDCTSGTCVDGYCCDDACTETCQACDVGGSLGTCSNVTGAPHGSRGSCGAYLCQGFSLGCPSTCSGDSGCVSGYWCNVNKCNVKKANGSTCPTGAHECSSGNCVDGYCCSATCGSSCEACDVSGSLGTCTNVTGAPHGSRTTCGVYLCQGIGATCPTTCSTDAGCVAGNWCNGTNCVAKKANGSTCATGAHECTSGICVDGYCCDGACGSSCQACDVGGSLGTCSNVTGAPHGSRTTCGLYVCQGTGATCPSTCSGDSGCSTGNWCSGTSCVAKKANGSTCPTGAHECTSNNCVDGYCCNAACAGQCEACDVGGSAGTCSPVSGAVHGSRTACTGTGACKATCDGSDRTKCASVPGTTVVCAAASCLVDTATPARYCDGLGSCAPVSTSKCDPYLCGPTACKTSCGTTADCATGYFCTGSTCVTTGALGTVCTSPSQCTSGNCVDGVCCSVSSCTAPLKCNANGLGTCSKPAGTTCTAGTECGSGFCVDSVCCNAACGGQCEACDVGGSVGTCVAVAGKPHGLRTSCTGTGTCQASCDGADRTKCGAPPGTSTVCAVAACTAGKATPTSYCDGLGVCSTPTVIDCGAYTCGGTTCKTTCGTSTDCATGYACKAGACVTTGALGTICTDDTQCTSTHCTAGATASVCCTTATCPSGSVCADSSAGTAAGTCVKSGGQTCGAATECASGFCVDGYCCDSVCGGQCEACDIPGGLGKCSGVTGAAHGTRTKCSDGGADVCKALACDGSKDRTKCAAFANGLDKECAPAVCKDGTLTEASNCDGSGTCKAGATKACPGNFACADKACKSSCSADTDCIGGYVCDKSTSKCVPPRATCNDDFTASIPADKSAPKPCTPYKCNPSSGDCFDKCSLSEQCAAGYVCDGTACVAAAPPETAADSGCGCETAGRNEPQSNGGLLALIGLALIGLRKSRTMRL